MSRACLSSSSTMRSRAVAPRGRATSVVCASMRPVQQGAGLAACSVAAIALMMGSPVGPALADPTPRAVRPDSAKDLPKDGPTVTPPGVMQPGDGTDLPRSNAKAAIDAQDISVGRRPAGQPRRISAVSAPSLYEVADLGDSVKSAIGFDRELGNTDAAGSGAAGRLQQSTKEAFSGDQVANQAASKLGDLKSQAQGQLGDLKSQAQGAVNQAKRAVSSAPAAPALYEVADLGSAVKSAIGFDRELGNTDSAGSNAGERLQASAKEAFSGNQASEAASKLQGAASSYAGQLKSDAKGAVGAAKGAIDRQLQ